jgi:K+-transporting ATPase KdpF subunit
MGLSTAIMLGVSVLLVGYLLFALLRPEKL